ncbi:MAG: S8 family serine peptidase [Chloroflexi bacterium]|nr:S8 family serine peptidase [Chloroflexota bacterium]
MRRIIPLLVILGLLLSATGGGALASGPKDGIDKISPELQAALAAGMPDDMHTVVVTLRIQAALSKIGGPDRNANLRAVVKTLQATAQAAQKTIISWLRARQSQGLVVSYLPLWVFNGLSVTATAATIVDLASLPDVRSIVADEISAETSALPDTALAEQNLAVINAPALWDLGWHGQGMVVASMDTGVDLSHPDLSAQWRGGMNSWYDPYGQHPSSPVDLSGHGTWTMGVMVGDSSGGSAIGVAPQAKWIAVKIFNDQGGATATAIHQGFQWLIDPDGNPDSVDAPNVVNNSWTLSGPGCDLQFQLDLQALRVAGILPVFAAGNFGPSGSTSVSPANYPEALAVGATDNVDNLYLYSSRGPSSCGESLSIYPEIVAPGVDIRTTDLYGFYTNTTGTSIAAPQVSGGLALLLSAFPNASADLQSAALAGSAVDLGPAGPDNDVGYGRLDIMAAYQWLQNAGNASPTSTSTPTADPTSTLTPTATADPSPSPTFTPTAAPSPTPTPSPTQDQGMIFSDGFESGDFTAWSSLTDGAGQLSVTGTAALSESFGMRANISGTTPAFLIDRSPQAENNYNARFLFAPNGVKIGSKKTHDLFAGVSAGGMVVMRVQIQLASGNYQVRGLVNTNNNREQATGWYTISNTSHAIEIGWQAASTSSGKDGSLSLWVDGSLLGTRSGVANGSLRVEQIQFGPQRIASGISGTEFYDSFTSTRGVYIGP